MSDLKQCPDCETVTITKKKYQALADKLKAADEVVDRISNIFNIGENARTANTIVANIENTTRRSDCLSKIESYLSVIEIDEEGEEYDESLLNWGESPDKYIETFKQALAKYNGEKG